MMYQDVRAPQDVAEKLLDCLMGPCSHLKKYLHDYIRLDHWNPSVVSNYTEKNTVPRHKYARKI